MTQSTLEQLVQDTVNTFIASGQSFSVYDVTTNIRNLVNSGAVEPIGVPVSGAGDYYEIAHSEVRTEFMYLFEDNGFSEPLTRNFNGSFFVFYSASGATQSVQPKVVAKAFPVQSLTAALNKQRNSVLPLSSSTSSSALDKATVISRVRQYLNGCNARGVTPTARQIQSAIKRNGKSTGWSRSDLNQIRNGINAGTV